MEFQLHRAMVSKSQTTGAGSKMCGLAPKSWQTHRFSVEISQSRRHIPQVSVNLEFSLCVSVVDFVSKKKTTDAHKDTQRKNSD
jgi:hypothetical protein